MPCPTSSGFTKVRDVSLLKIQKIFWKTSGTGSIGRVPHGNPASAFFYAAELGLPSWPESISQSVTGEGQWAVSRGDQLLNGQIVEEPPQRFSRTNATLRMPIHAYELSVFLSTRHRRTCLPLRLAREMVCLVSTWVLGGTVS